MKLKEALKLQYGDIVEHKSLINADGTPLRLRINGAIKTWKRDKDRLRIPFKYGLYDHGYLVNGTIEGSVNIDIKEVRKQ